MRVVLDSNVLIAAVAARGLCESVLELCLEEHQLVVCPRLLEEVGRILTAKLLVPKAVSEEYVQLLVDSSVEHYPEDVPPEACPDPDDLFILGLCEASKADYLVTGDHALLGCGWGSGTEIVTPRSFWEECAGRP